jgi:hypothetical protein
MIKKILLSLACLALASCATLGNLATTNPVDVASDQLAMTAADEKLFDALTSAVTVAANSAELLALAGVVPPKSPEAQKVAGLLDTTRNAINRAYAIWRGTVTGNRAVAMQEVNAAFADLSAELAKWRKAR